MTPTKAKMKSDSDNDSLNFQSNYFDRIAQLEEKLEERFKSLELGFNEKFDRILNYLDALNLSKKDDTVIIDESKSSVSTRADDPNQIIRNTNTSSQLLLLYFSYCYFLGYSYYILTTSSQFRLICTMSSDLLAKAIGSLPKQSRNV